MIRSVPGTVYSPNADEIGHPSIVIASSRADPDPHCTRTSSSGSGLLNLTVFRGERVAELIVSNRFIEERTRSVA